MAVRPSLERRGWGYDLPNTRLGAYVDGIEAIRLTKSVTGADWRILGDTPATYYINWSASTYTLNLRGKLTTGVSGTGYDVQLFGATAGASLLWDASDNALEVVGLASIEVGTTGTPLVLTAGTPIFDMYTTCATVHASTSAESVLFNTVMTGAGGVGGRVRVNMETNVALGGWANAFKATVDCKTNGKATGLLSVVNAELTQAASNTGAGTNAVYEAEVVCPASWADTKYTSIMYIGTSGATKTNFDTTGLFLEINGVAVGSGKFFQVNTAAAATHALRCRIGGVLYYVMLTSVGA